MIRVPEPHRARFACLPFLKLTLELARGPRGRLGAPHEAPELELFLLHLPEVFLRDGRSVHPGEATRHGLELFVVREKGLFEFLGNARLLFLEKSDRPVRSEEHTSELQSRLHLVCRLLLEKK